MPSKTPVQTAQVEDGGIARQLKICWEVRHWELMSPGLVLGDLLISKFWSRKVRETRDYDIIS
jgi:hypothetical protein